AVAALVAVHVGGAAFGQRVDDRLAAADRKLAVVVGLDPRLGERALKQAPPVVGKALEREPCVVRALRQLAAVGVTVEVGRRRRRSSCGSAAARARSAVRSSRTTTRATTPASCGGSQTSSRSPCATNSCGVSG